MGVHFINNVNDACTKLSCDFWVILPREDGYPTSLAQVSQSNVLKLPIREI